MNDFWGLTLAGFLWIVTAPVLAFGIPVPQGSSTTWVAQDMNQNGLPMQIVQIKSALDVGAVLEFYRQEWIDPYGDTPGYLESSVGEWSVISRLAFATQYVVQIKPAGLGSSAGFLSIIELNAGSETHSLSDDFPRLTGSEPISTSNSRDQDAVATTIILQNDFSVSSNKHFYQSKMRSKGWSLVHTLSRDSTDLIFFNKSGRALEIAISQSSTGKAVIFANFISDES